MKTKLGEETSYKENYSPEVLDFIPRDLSRTQTGITQLNQSFFGYDLWNGYEFSWLTKNGAPKCGVIQIVVPASSTHICESKSLKLYLGGFSFERFDSEESLTSLIQRDLALGIGAQVSVTIIPLQDDRLKLKRSSGFCLDEQDLSDPSFEYDPDLLQISDFDVTETLYTNQFRSLCPVTSQPDWASIYVKYSGKKIENKSLLRYLISFRRHQGFHESCCEQIFADIIARCSPRNLEVLCCFTRRGGLDINPLRSTQEISSPFFHRTTRQ